jgi:hypothetical protein
MAIVNSAFLFLIEAAGFAFRLSSGNESFSENFFIFSG